jgi:type IV pilus assembly protein PilA
MENGRHRTNGFTLIELMIVIAIVAILVTLAVPAYKDYTIRAKVTECIGAAAIPKLQISEFYQVQSRWPTNFLEAGISHDFTLLFGAGMSDYCSMFFYPGGNGHFYILVDTLSIDPSLGFLKINPILSPIANTGGGVSWVCTRGATGAAAIKYLPSSCRGSNII